MAQAVELVEAVEKSRRTYMFAENCPYMLFNQEMRRIYRSGAIGQFVYGEGEYVHPGPAEFWNSISPGEFHWRNWLPATYYSTHSLAPLMYITDTMPKKVNALVMPFRPDDLVAARPAQRRGLDDRPAMDWARWSSCCSISCGARACGCASTAAAARWRTSARATRRWSASAANSTTRKSPRRATKSTCPSGPPPTAKPPQPGMAGAITS